MERLNPEQADLLREYTLRLTNQLLRIENGQIGYLPPDPIFCDVSFFEEAWGLKLFEKPLLVVNFSDETFEEGLGEFLGREVFLEGYDDTVVCYQSSSPYLFGITHGEGSFGDHDTNVGIMAYKSGFGDEDLTDEKVRDYLQNLTSKRVEPSLKKDKILPRPRKLLVASLETGEIIYNESFEFNLIAYQEGINFLWEPLNGQLFVDLATSGKYFVCIARPDRIGRYLEHREKFEIDSAGELFSR